MISTRDIIHRSSDALSEVPHALRRSAHAVERRPMRTIGIVFLALTIVGAIYLLPEFMRYVKMERM